MTKTLSRLAKPFNSLSEGVSMADDQIQKTIVDRVFAWAAGQPFNNVLLLLILGGGAWLVIDRVPVHLNMIQNGYREVINTSDKQHREEREEMLKNHREERERTQQFYDKLMDKVSGNAHYRSSNVAKQSGE